MKWYIYIYDGNATLQSLPKSLPDKFENLALMVFNLLPKTSQVDFVTDTYKTNSIKSFEHKKRGCSPTFLLSGPKTKTPETGKVLCQMMTIRHSSLNFC